MIRSQRLYNLMKPLISSHKMSLSSKTTSNEGSETSRQVKKAPYDGVLYTKHNEFVTEVTLNKPKKYNALDLKMVRDILRKIRSWVPYNIDGFSSDSSEPNDSHKPKVVLFSGNGKAFCAGGDIVDLFNARQSGNSPRIFKDFFRYEYLLDYSLTKIEPIQVSFWNGAVMGGGVGLSINSPFRIATDSTVFAMPETKIGLFTDIGASYFLPRLLNNSLELGVYLGLTGDKVQGKDLAISGVATHYIKEDKFAKLKEILIEKVNSKTNKETLKALISENTDITFNPDKFEFNNLEAIKYAFKPDSLDGIFTRLNNLVSNKSIDEKEDKLIKSLYNDNIKAWAEKCLKSLHSHSPLSLVITLELLKRGQKLSNIEEAFNLEAQLVAGFMEDSDFFEGVRALLIDKDNSPKWSSKTYKDINTQEVIKKYFERKEEIEVDQKL